MAETTRAILELAAGPFVLALPTHLVSAVEAAPTPEPDGELMVDAELIAYADLIELFHVGHRVRAPLAIVLDPPDGTSRVAIGVDRVDHVHGASHHPSPIPPLGLHLPRLFTGAARVQDRILLVLDPTILAGVVRGDG